jgi:hypothetical protein
MNRFYVATADEALKIANKLVKLNYEETDSVIVIDDDQMPMLLIDTFASSFFFLDQTAFDRASPIISNILREKVWLADYHTVKEWDKVSN